jgi:hypothetical protein
MLISLVFIESLSLAIAQRVGKEDQVVSIDSLESSLGSQTWQFIKNEVGLPPKVSERNVSSRYCVLVPGESKNVLNIKPVFIWHTVGYSTLNKCKFIQSNGGALMWIWNHDEIDVNLVRSQEKHLLIYGDGGSDSRVLERGKSYQIEYEFMNPLERGKLEITIVDFSRSQALFHDLEILISSENEDYQVMLKRVEFFGKENLWFDMMYEVLSYPDEEHREYIYSRLVEHMCPSSSSSETETP